MLRQSSMYELDQHFVEMVMLGGGISEEVVDKVDGVEFML
jgi:hypothetical protein